MPVTYLYERQPISSISMTECLFCYRGHDYGGVNLSIKDPVKIWGGMIVKAKLFTFALLSLFNEQAMDYNNQFDCDHYFNTN